MKIIVTGGCGFIGSNYVLNQVNSNHEVLNIDKITYAGNQENLVSISNSSNYSFIKCDISDIKAVTQVIKQFEPQAIVHFAAESHVDRSIYNPMKFINTNIVGTATLLQAALEYWKLKNTDFRFIHVSTDEVYGTLNEKGLFTEETPYNPNSPYSASKASSDHLVRAWNRTYDFPAIITNCSNNYGPYQFPEKLIPMVITNCLNEVHVPIYGKGHNIRDWLYVEDHCTAIDMVLKRGKTGETYNIGGYNEIRNIDIVNSICKILNELSPRNNGQSYESLIKYVKDRPGHDYRYAIDASKISKELGWKPKETFDSGIKKTISWYLKNKKWWEKIYNNSYN